MQKIRVGTLCSGYDSQCLALERLKRDYPSFDYELMWWSDIDKYAIKAHNALFPQWAERNLGDMTKIDWTKCEKVDLLFYSTPCQSISQAGLQHGFVEGSGTRSSIIWNVKDAITILRPKFAILENVSAMVSTKFIDMFNLWQLTIEELGYKNYSKILNAKDYGVPQNRDRIFLLSIREDVDLHFYFPNPFPLTKLLKDVLEENVDEKYFISDACLARLKKNTGKDDISNQGEVAKTLTVGMEKLTSFDNYIKVVKQNKWDDCTTNAITTVQKDNLIIEEERIRKLTERECFRLMGVDDSDIDKIQSACISMTQQYKMAGNSIVVDVLYHIFRKLLVDTKADTGTQLELF